MRRVFPSLVLVCAFFAPSHANERSARVAKAACFWGGAAAMIEVARDLCPNLRAKDVAQDAINNLSIVAGFDRCLAEGRATMARTRPVTDRDVALFCAFIGTSRNFSGEDTVMEPK